MPGDFLCGKQQQQKNISGKSRQHAVTQIFASKLNIFASICCTKRCEVPKKGLM